MDLTPPELTAFMTDVRQKFTNGVNDAKGKRLWQPKLLGERDMVNGKDAEILWSEKSPRMKKWISNKEIQNFMMRGFRAPNEAWHNLHEIDEADFERRDARKIGNIVKSMSRAAADWEKWLIVDAFRGGGATFPGFLGYDKVPVFSSAHPIHPNNVAMGLQANDFTGMPLNTVNYEAAVATFMSFAGFDGEPLGVYPDMLIVTPANAAEGARIINARTVLTGGENVNAKNGMQLVIMPELIPPGTPANSPILRTWYLACTTQDHMPITMQIEKEPILRSNLPSSYGGVQGGLSVAPADGSVIATEKLLLDTPARGCAYFLAWWMIARFAP